MEQTSQLTFVRTEIDEQVQRFRSRQNYNRKATFLFTIASSAVSALATVLIGVSELYDAQKVWPFLAMVATAVVTVVSAWSALFGNRKMWLTAGTAVGDLEALDRDIRFSESRGAVSDADADAFYKRYCHILQTAEESWRGMVQE